MATGLGMSSQLLLLQVVRKDRYLRWCAPVPKRGRFQLGSPMQESTLDPQILRGATGLGYHC